MDQRHMVHPRAQPFLGSVDGGPIPVDADESAGGQPFGDLPGVAGSSQRTVHVDTVRPDAQCVDALVQQHGLMDIFHGFLPPVSAGTGQRIQSRGHILALQHPLLPLLPRLFVPDLRKGVETDNGGRLFQSCVLA